VTETHHFTEPLLTYRVAELNGTAKSVQF